MEMNTEKGKNKLNEDQRKFGSGATRGDSTGKGRFDLIPPEGLIRLAKRYEYGAVRYGDQNWKKGIPVSSLVDSVMRHLCQYMAGDQSEDHLAACSWNLFALMYKDEKSKKKNGGR